MHAGLAAASLLPALTNSNWRRLPVPRSPIRVLIFLCTVVPLLALGAWYAWPGTGQPPTTHVDSVAAGARDSIATAAVELFTTWGRLEPEPYLALFSDDFEFYIEGKRLTRPAFESAVRQAMAALRERGWDAAMTSGPHTEVLGPDAAVVSFLYEVREERTDGGTVTLPWAWTLVYERRDDVWQVVQAHESFAPIADSRD